MRRWTETRATVLVLGTLVLAGCVETTESIRTGMPLPKPPPVEARLPPLPATKPAPPQLAATVEPTPPSQAEPAAALAADPKDAVKPATPAGAHGAVMPPPGQLDPATLVGLDEQATRRLLGEPSWTEDAPPGKYWRYATPTCVLRVFFFMEVNSQDFRALSYELTSSDDAPNVDQRCFTDLVSRAYDHQAADDATVY